MPAAGVQVGQILVGPSFNEPMRVETAVPDGTRWLVAWPCWTEFRAVPACYAVGRHALAIFVAFRGASLVVLRSGCAGQSAYAGHRRADVCPRGARLGVPTGASHLRLPKAA